MSRVVCACLVTTRSPASSRKSEQRLTYDTHAFCACITKHVFVVSVLPKKPESFAFIIYGDAPRKPGDKWTVDPKTITEFAGMKKMEGSFNVEFVEVKDIAGTPCAVLKISFDLSGVSTEESENPMKMKIKGEVATERSLAELVDLQSKCTATMSGDGSPAEGVTMSVEGPFAAETTASVAKKKAE